MFLIRYLFLSIILFLTNLSASTPFSCTNESFVSFNTSWNGATSGTSKFNTISLLDGTRKSEDSVNGVYGVNSIGYNVKDNYVWGYNLNADKVIKIGKDMSSQLYNISGLVERFYVAADVDANGILYLFSRGSYSQKKTLVRVDLNTLTKLSDVTLSESINTADMAFNPQDGKLYFLQRNSRDLYNITFSNNGTTGTVHDLGDLGIGTVDPIINFFDKDGNFYFNKNSSNMYKVNVATTHTASWFSELDNDLQNGDGARCANASVEKEDRDFGDAPDSYAHVSHIVSDDLFLGYKGAPDVEDDQQSSPHATGDGADDNDSILKIPTLEVGANYYKVPILVTNKTEKPAYLTAWIDFNRNGVFEYSEAINRENLAVPTSPQIGFVDIEWDITDANIRAIENATDGKAFLRVRLSSEPVPRNNSGLMVSPDGEIQDYEIPIKKYPPATDPFSCTNEGVIFTSNRIDSDDASVSIIDLEKETHTFIQKFGTRHINSIGYNVKDNFIYGIGYTNKTHNTMDVVKVDKNYNVEKLNVTGLPQGNSLYALGDVDFDNHLYVSTMQSENSSSNDFLKSLIVIDLDTKRVERQTPLVFPAESNMTNIKSADYAFNPKDEMLYTIDSNTNQLVRINPISGQVELLGDIGNIGNAYSVISFFDLDGNFLFTNNNNTAIYKIDISDPDNIDTIATVYIADIDMSNSGDGAKCAYSRLPKYDPIPCQTSAFMFSDLPTEIGLLNLVTGEMDSSKGRDFKTEHLNAVGYNKKDGYIWGVDQESKDGTLIKVGLDDNGNYLGKKFKIAGETFDAYIGDVNDDGQLYIKTGNKTEKTILVIDLDPTSSSYLKKVNDLNLSQEIDIHDWAFNPQDGFIYAVTKSANLFMMSKPNRLYKIDPSDGTVTLLGNTHMDERGNIGAAFFDKKGNLYVYANKTGKVYQIDVDVSSEAKLFSEASIDLKRNDGAMCSDIILKPLSKPFVCSDDTLYLSNRSQIGTGTEDSGKTWLHNIDRETNPYSYSPIGSGYTLKYNAMGYNVKDNFIYAMFKNELLRIDSLGAVENLGKIEGYPDTNQRYAGEFDRDGYYYVTNDGGGDKLMLKIDVSKRKVVKIIMLNENGHDAYPVFWDIAIDKSGDYFYMMRLDNNSINYKDNLKVTKINIATGELTSIGKVHSELSSHIEITYSDVNGDIYMQESNNGFYRVNIETGELVKLSSTLPLTDYADGTSCPDANISEPPGISITSNVMKKEGDSGTTDFIFNVNINRESSGGMMGMMSTMGFRFKITDGTATLSDNDYMALANVDGSVFQMGSFIKILPTTENITITVKVKGDIKIEEDETFFVDIYSPKFIGVVNSRGTGVILNDDAPQFNIERIGLSSTTVETQAEQDAKESFYTQIAEHDFDYTIVSYDKNNSNFQEFDVEDMTVRVDLIDNENGVSPDNRLYRFYTYLGSKNSRFDITTQDANQLKLHASKNVRFKISYLENNNTLLKGDFSIDEFESHPDYIKTLDARDAFAIRPSGFKMILSVDKNGTKNELEVSSNVTNEVTLASGSQYELKVQALGYTDEIESTYKTETVQTDVNGVILPSEEQEVNATLKFNDSSSCIDKNDTPLEYFDFIGGVNQNRVFKHDNVGKYLVAVLDTNWTNVDYSSDEEKRGCILNSSSNIVDNNGKYGCDISTTFINDNSKNYKELKVAFEPYSFDMNMSVHNSRGDKEYLYMSNLNRSDEMALVLEGSLLAKSKDGKTTDNFTSTCAAKKVTFGLDYLAESSEGNFTKDFNLSTTDGTPVDIQRMISHNEGAYSAVDDDALDKNITILASHFRDNATVKGSSKLSVLYNIEKHMSETINPVRLHLNIAKVSSTEAKSITSESDNFTPKGDENISRTKLFYFSKVSPDEEEYPATKEDVYSTPVTISIFCEHNSTWCTDMIGGNGRNSIITSSGWYTAFNHDSSFEGRILGFNSTFAEVLPNINSLKNFNENSGRNDELITHAIAEGTRITTKVDVILDEWLKYHRKVSQNGNPFWLNTFNQTFGQISGVGKSGKMLSIQGNMVGSKRIDW